MAVGEEGDSVLDRGRAVRTRAWRESRARSASRVSSSTTWRPRSNCGRPWRQSRRQLRSEPFLLAGSGCAGRDPRARPGHLPHARQGRLSRPAERRGQRRHRYQDVSPHGRSARGCSAASASATTSSNGSASSARCGWPATTTSSASSTRMRSRRSTKGCRPRSTCCRARFSPNRLWRRGGHE